MNADVNFAIHKSLEEVYQDPNFEGFGKPCDTRLRTDDGTEFQVYSSVLSAKSEFFRALFSIDDDDDRNCPVIHGIKPDVFEAILIYLCTGSIDLNKENMMHILVAADSLMIDSLLCKARVFVMKNKTVHNCIELFTTSYRIKGLDMKDQCSRFLLLCFERAVKFSEDEAYELSINTLMYFLSHKSINVSKERFVWSFIEKWVQKEADNRLQRVPDLLKCLHIDEIDDELALDIISSSIIQKHLKRKDFGDCLPLNVIKKSGLFTLLREDIQFISGARLPPCLYFITKLSNGFRWDMFMTYDDSLDVWGKLGSLPSSLINLLRIDHNMYIFTRRFGSNNDIFNEGFIFNLLNYEIRVMNPYPSHLGFVVEFSGRIYALGGVEHEESGEVQVYIDEEDKWKKVSPMQTMQLSVEAVSANGHLYAIGEKESRMFMQVYHPSTDEWKTASPPNIRRSYMKAVEYRGRIFVVGGYRPDIGHSSEVEAYDPASDEWSLCPPLPFTRSNSLKCAVMRGRLYVFQDRFVVHWDDSGEWKTVSTDQCMFHYSFCSIEGEEVVREIMKRNRAACTTEWHETSIGMIFA